MNPFVRTVRRGCVRIIEAIDGPAPPPAMMAGKEYPLSGRGFEADDALAEAFADGVRVERARMNQEET